MVDNGRQDRFQIRQFTHLLFAYRIGQIGSAGLMYHCTWIFQVPFRREWWRQARSGYLADATSRKERRFVALVDKALAVAIEQSPKDAGPQLQPPRQRRPGPRRSAERRRTSSRRR